MHDDDISQWIAQARQGDQDAIRKLWAKYVNRLLRVARFEIGQQPRRTYDEEDIVQSAMNSFFKKTSDRFADVEHRDDLWRVLVTITRRKAISAQRKQTAIKRGGRIKTGAADEVAQIVGSEPTPEFAAMVAEECRQRLDQLDRIDSTLRIVAQLKLEGHTNEEIAEQLSRTTRTVARKIRRIRSIWSEEPSDEHLET